MTARVVVGGLGPADSTLTTSQTLDAVAGATHVRLRTAMHPAAASIDAASYDHLYESADSFGEVYDRIVDDVVALAGEGVVVYLVPGAPTVAERTVELLIGRDDVDVEVLPAMSFLDLAWARLRIDPVERGVRLVDGHVFDPSTVGPGALLIGQCHDSVTMSDIKLSYDDVEPASAVLLHHLGLVDEQIIEVPWSEIDRTIEPDHLTSLFVPDAPSMGAGRAVERLDGLVHRLRNDCPWDREQDHVSLIPHLIEETYEVVEVLDAAADRGDANSVDPPHLCEELGDLLFQVVLHAAIAEERFDFVLSDVVDGVHDKLFARHPHVFGDVEVDDLVDLAHRWDRIKAEEKGRERVLDGLPALPSLPLAAKVVHKARRAGFVWGDVSEAWAKLHEEIGEFEVATEDDRFDELGDVLFSVIGLAHDLDIDADAALRRAVRKFRHRFEAVEDHLAISNTPMRDVSIDELLEAWRVAKHGATK